MAKTAENTKALKFLLHLDSFSCPPVLDSVIINLVKVGADGFDVILTEATNNSYFSREVLLTLLI